MTKEILEAKKAELTKNLDEAKVVIYRIDGAICVLNDLLAGLAASAEPEAVS